jgi:hypothetical protein
MRMRRSRRMRMRWSSSKLELNKSYVWALCCKKFQSLVPSLSRTIQQMIYWFNQFIDPRYSKVTFSKTQNQQLSMRTATTTEQHKRPP